MLDISWRAWFEVLLEGVADLCRDRLSVQRSCGNDGQRHLREEPGIAVQLVLLAETGSFIIQITTSA